MLQKTQQVSELLEFKLEWNLLTRKAQIKNDCPITKHSRWLMDRSQHQAIKRIFKHLNNPNRDSYLTMHSVSHMQLIIVLIYFRIRIFFTRFKEHSSSRLKITKEFNIHQEMSIKMKRLDFSHLTQVLLLKLK